MITCHRAGNFQAGSPAALRSTSRVSLGFFVYTSCEWVAASTPTIALREDWQETARHDASGHPGHTQGGTQVSG